MSLRVSIGGILAVTVEDDQFMRIDAWHSYANDAVYCIEVK